MKKMFQWLTLAAATTITSVAFVACAPSNMEEAKEKMETAGYTVEISTQGLPSGGVSMLNAEKEDVEEVLSAVLFSSSASAKIYYQTNKDRELPNGMVLEHSGEWVCLGTPTAVDVFLD